MGPGYLVLTPLRLDDGAHVIVNRGYVPQELKDPAKRAQSRAAGEVEVTGLMRPPEPRNLFTPVDEPGKGIYFTRDPAEFAAHFGLARTAPLASMPTPRRCREAGRRAARRCGCCRTTISNMQSLGSAWPSGSSASSPRW